MNHLHLYPLYIIDNKQPQTLSLLLDNFAIAFYLQSVSCARR